MPHSSFIQPAEYWLNRAGLAMEKDDYLRAAAFYRHALSLPDCPEEAGGKYAFLLHRMGHIYPAFLECMHSLAMDPLQLSGRGVLCMTLLDLGMDQEAEDAIHSLFSYHRILSERPPLSPARRNLPPRAYRRRRKSGVFLRAFSHLDSGRIEKGRRLLPVLRRYGGSSAQLLCLEACFSDNLEACLTYCRQVAKKAPLQPMRMLRCCKALSRFSKKEAFPFLLLSAIFASSVKELTMLCSLCRSMGVSYIAIAALRRELEYFPSRADTLYNLSVLLYEQEQKEEALLHAEKLVLSNPEDPSYIWLRKTLLSASPAQMPLPFYGEKNPALERETLLWLEQGLNNQPLPFSDSPLNLRQNRQKLMFLFSGVLDAPSSLAVLRRIAALCPENAGFFLRYYLLFRPHPVNLRRAVALLASIAPPPYFAHRENRFISVDPKKAFKVRQPFAEKRLISRMALYKKELNRFLYSFLQQLMFFFTDFEKLHLSCGDPGLWLRAYRSEVGQFLQRPCRIKTPGSNEKRLFDLYSTQVRNALIRLHNTCSMERSEPPHESH